jgi:hypothetical protein
MPLKGVRFTPEPGGLMDMTAAVASFILYPQE